jgi:hypothetical protein
LLSHGVIVVSPTDKNWQADFHYFYLVSKFNFCVASVSAASSGAAKESKLRSGAGGGGGGGAGASIPTPEPGARITLQVGLAMGSQRWKHWINSSIKSVMADLYLGVVADHSSPSGFALGMVEEAGKAAFKVRGRRSILALFTRVRAAPAPSQSSILFCASSHFSFLQLTGDGYLQVTAPSMRPDEYLVLGIKDDSEDALVLEKPLGRLTQKWLFEPEAILFISKLGLSQGSYLAAGAASLDRDAPLVLQVGCGAALLISSGLASSCAARCRSWSGVASMGRGRASSVWTLASA